MLEIAMDKNVTEMVTTALAAIGAVLGVINTWNEVNKRSLKLKVTPQGAIPIGGGPLMFCIEVINLSDFSVTINDVGFSEEGLPFVKKGRLPVMNPILIDGGCWPRRLSPREAVTVYFDRRNAFHPEHRVDKAYAKTSCGEMRYGNSPALRQLKKEMEEYRHGGTA